MTILHIETSTTICSIALSRNGELLFEKTDTEGMKHAERLSPFVDEALQFLKSKNLKLDAVAVSAGPGSYTGLRIGTSTAKGLSYGFNIPLITIPSLEILCNAVISSHKIENDALLCPMLDARRMEVYTATYTNKLEIVDEVRPLIIDENAYQSHLAHHKTYFFGNGASKTKDIITDKNAHFIDDVEVLAKNMISSAEQKYKENNFADVAYFEPIYLKEFMATIPKKLF